MNILAACAVLLLCGFTFAGPETELLARINQERAAQGVPPLAVNWEAARLARYKAEEMRGLGFFGHDSPVYGTAGEMLAHFNIPFSAAGVNIAKGQETAAEAAAAWLASPAHRENLLNESFTSAGAGLSRDEDMAVWAVILIGLAPEL